MENITIRPAETQDARGIARVHVETWQYAYRGQLPNSYLAGLTVEKREQLWKESLGDPKYIFKVFVAVDGREVMALRVFVLVGMTTEMPSPASWRRSMLIPDIWAKVSALSS